MLPRIHIILAIERISLGHSVDLFSKFDTTTKEGIRKNTRYS